MSTPQAIQRLLKSSRREDVPRAYRGTCSLVDEESRQVLASCDLSGQATFATVSILTPDRRTWTMKPNRKIIPLGRLRPGEVDCRGIRSEHLAETDQSHL